MAGHCKNCNTKLGCSCKRRTASDGKSCCATCVAGYQKKLAVQKPSSAKPLGVILSATAVQKK